MVPMTQRQPRPRPLGGRRHARRRGRLDLRGRVVGRPVRHLAPRRRDQDRRPAIDVELMLDGGRGPARAGRRGVPDRRRRAARHPDRRRDRAARHAPARSGPARRALTAPRWPPCSPRYPLRDLVSSSGRSRSTSTGERALYGSWYEFFPRSEGAASTPRRARCASRHASAPPPKRLPADRRRWASTSSTCRRSTPSAELNRKGAEQHPRRPVRDDPGLALGDRLRAEGGHDAIHPDLGTDRRLRRTSSPRRSALGLEVALDFALQCAPDHPWVTSTPSGSPPAPTAPSPTPRTRRRSTRTSTRSTSTTTPRASTPRSCASCGYWMDHGVRIFRVDNPHTKPVAFWEWLLARDPRAPTPTCSSWPRRSPGPAMMRTLGDGRLPPVLHLLHLAQRRSGSSRSTSPSCRSETAAPACGPTSSSTPPTSCHAFLQYGGPPAFKIRAVLAATRRRRWGVYAGFELFEHVAVRPGSEEYLDSEKYQLRPRDWAAAEAEGRTLAPYLTRLNESAARHPRCSGCATSASTATDNDHVLAYSKTHDRRRRRHRDRRRQPRPARRPRDHGHLDLPALGMDWDDTFAVHDEITGETWPGGEHNYVRLDPSRAGPRPDACGGTLQ